MDVKPVKRRFSQSQARHQFMKILAEKAPECYDDLMRLEVDGFPNAEEENEFIFGWQRDWNLIEAPNLIAHWAIKDEEIDPSAFGDNVPGRRELHRTVRENHPWGRGGWITRNAKITLLQAKQARDKGAPLPGEFAWIPDIPFERFREEMSKPEPMEREQAEALWAKMIEDTGETKPISDKEFVNFVNFQVLRASLTSLAQSESVAKSSMIDAMNDLARFLWIDPRDGRLDAGRPRRPRLSRTIKLT